MNGRLNEMEFLHQVAVKTELNESAEQEDSPVGAEKQAQVGLGSRLDANDKTMQQNTIKLAVEWSTKKTINSATEKSKGAVAKPIPPPPKAYLVKDVYQRNREEAERHRAEEERKKRDFSSRSATEKSKGAVAKAIPPPPKAYLVKDVYLRKREEAERHRAEEERKKREFYSRPAPNYAAYHEQLQKRKPIHAVTVAITPQVLKNSRENDEKRRKRLEELKLKNKPPKFEHRPPTVLKEKPFVPEKKPMVLEQCPFQLNMEKRLQERKQYDELKQKAMEEKQKQLEEERKKREEGLIKELRKAATFKARPNPFKN